MSILITDDDPGTQRLLEIILETAGYDQVLIASSADDAFAKLGMTDSAAANTEVDLILMDVSMRGVDGIEACRRIKANPDLRNIPIIMVTGRTEADKLKTAFEAGASDYITKPLDRVELLARIDKVLQQKEELDRHIAREQELLTITQQLEQANLRLYHLSSVDPLTGIANRRHFDDIFELEWRRAMRSGSVLSLIMIDIDAFKPYNDTYGHLQGDECLRRVADALRSELKRPSDMVARFGGEEFVVLLPGTGLAGAALVAETLRARVEALRIPHEASRFDDHVTVSVGVASIHPQRGARPADLLAAADQALYQVKQGIRNRVQLADADQARVRQPQSQKEQSH
jgi:diguanylate cyclase (GGDEF)-like protein